MTVKNVLRVDAPDIMNIEDAKAELQSEREAYWAHLTDTKLRKERRCRQNRINKYISRWREEFHLVTTEDYHPLACELQDMREGGKPDTETSNDEDSIFDSPMDFHFGPLDEPSSKEIDDVSYDIFLVINVPKSMSDPALAPSGEKDLNAEQTGLTDLYLNRF
ncbi:predicted protein [Sclerotinia sclerotiorum 1980 UF-70]|uniref:Uncharacterized protein n=2 Tax=Sclerotinia sclerotiorum (strain ATCC 18683 / 1980 / Ss-1) TaxID=665079 RepID=A7ERU6_SCLS1|nr:predicted protein [Sclerotinia sclerotiorum 1980 UF-70]APA13363.1 hypothetical protein sscle_11g081330 [Sclerotinia sclerotiorum 1980 UF-70]EDN92188.1 predicted protein [Sclerotinia sclerotiorum 1980 UF-70]